MKIKKYTGLSLESIFAKVKSDLGEKAVILSTKKIRENGVLGIPKIEVTAALTPPIFDEAVLPQKAADGEACQKFLEAVRAKITSPSATTAQARPGEQDMHPDGSDPVKIREDIAEIKSLLRAFCLGNAASLSPALEALRSLLTEAHVEEDVMVGLLDRARSSPLPAGSDGRAFIEEAVAGLIRTQAFPLDLAPGEVVILLGTTGVGKTTTLAKMASIASLTHGRKVALVSMDTYRVGAHEHLQHYARILNIPVVCAPANEDIASKVRELRDRHAVFIDSSGVSQYNKLRIRELYARIRDIPDAKRILLISAATHPSESRRTLENFSEAVGISGLIITKLDETEKPGQVLSLNRFAQTPVCFVTDGQGVPDSIRPARSLEIARKILYGQYAQPDLQPETALG